MKVTRTITVETSIEEGPRILLPDGHRVFRVTGIRECLWPTGLGDLRYRVDLMGPIVTQSGADHAGREGGIRSYFPGDGALRADWGKGDPIPAELAHLVRGRAALEALA